MNRLPPAQIAGRVLAALFQGLRQDPPPGMDRAYLDSFERRYRPALEQVLLRRLLALRAERSAADAPEPPADLWTPARRREANLAALHLLAERPEGPFTADERATLARYSGWGGLSLDEVEGRLPTGLPAPERRGLIHEYYTPTVVAQAIGQALRPRVPSLPRAGAQVLALEPSAGIGRLILAASGSGFESLSWHAVEYSALSARLLQALRPDLRVFEGPFERWVRERGPAVAGQLGLVLSNPPYGQRGAAVAEDPDRSYRESDRIAWRYFVRRALDLLAPGGLGVFVIPGGFLTSTGAEARDYRERVLRRHHLAAAFRLPNEPSLVPGVGQALMDVVWLRSRGGELDTLPPEDGFILDGAYFSQHPGHVLGVQDAPFGQEADGHEGQGSYRSYVRVRGRFEGLPTFTERPLVRASRPSPAPAPVTARQEITRRLTVDTAGLTEDLASAVQLGARVDRFLAASSREDSAEAAQLWPELVDALRGWVSAWGIPHAHPGLRQRARDGDVAAQRLLNAFTRTGDLVEGLERPPVFTPRYTGRRDDLVAMAAWLYGQQRALRVPELLRFAAGQGLRDPSLEPLWAAGWCRDGEAWDELLPGEDYLSGTLWPRHDRAVLRAAQGDAQAEAQLRRLLLVMRLVEFEELGTINPREGWIPLLLLTEWVNARLSPRPVALERRRGLLHVEGLRYEEHTKEAGIHPRVLWFVGACNHDRTLFDPGQHPSGPGELGARRRKGERVDTLRLAWLAWWNQDFTRWVGEDERRRTLAALAYNKLRRGYAPPPVHDEPLEIARWTRGGIQLKPHQVAGARRVLRQRGGLIGFDVGVGKTFTACAIIARARQEGWCRRPVVLVPNSIVWKWQRDLQRVLPDFRVLVIGATRREVEAPLSAATVRLARPDAAARWAQRRARNALGLRLLEALRPGEQREVGELAQQAGVKASAELLRTLAAEGYLELRPAPPRLRGGPDTPEERGRKWTQFQAGACDVVLLTYGALNRTRLNEAAVLRYAQHTEAIQAALALWQRNAKERLGSKSFTERDQAILSEGMAAWVSQVMEIPEGFAYDPGVAWDDLGIDLLVVDEAQNFKNLYLPEPREFGVPRFMGNAGEGSDRAWQLDFRAAAVRARTGGTGIVLLSATPAKNSPLELYNLIQYIDHDAWRRLGLAHPEAFIDRFCKLEPRLVLNSKLEMVERSACVGFQHLDELRAVLDRFCEFKTAEEVGLRLPQPRVHIIEVDLDGQQEALYARKAAEIERLSTSRANAGQVLALLTQLGLIALHPHGHQKHTWGDALTLPEADWSSPKLEALAARIVGSRYQVEALALHGGDGSLALGEPVALDRGALTVLAYGETHPGHSVGRVVLELEEAPGRWTPWWTREVQGRFREAEDQVPLSQGGRLRVRAEGTSELTVALNLPRSTQDDRCEDEWSCRCGHVVFCDSLAVHRWLVEVLVKAGVPRDRIAVLNATTAPSPSDRQRIADEFNGDPEAELPPRYDVVICNAVAYEGVDLQARTCALHHLDLPWEPSTLQQRNGRGVRQGNRLSAIEINYYFARRSMDGFRFGLIQGKRGWLTALLESQDRETNNPAAQLQLGPEEVMLMISRTPEQTAARLAALRAAHEKEAREKLAKNAASSLTAANQRFRRAERTEDPALARVYRTEGEALLGEVLALAPGAWPWQPWAAKVRELPMWVLPETGPVVYPGLRVLFERRLVELGETDIRKGELVTGLRFYGEGHWQAARLPELVRLIPGPEVLDPPWPGDDEERIAANLEATLHRKIGSTGRIVELNWSLAPDAWVARAWARHGAAVLRQLAAAPPSAAASQPLPVRRAGRLELLPARGLDLDEVLPPTEAGWQELLRLAPASELRWTALRDAALAWWVRHIPQNLLVQREAP